MLHSDLASVLAGVTDWISTQFAAWSGPILDLKIWIVEHFGTNGLIAVLVVVGVLAVFVVSQLVRITIATLKYLVIPSVALAFLASLLLPVTFVAALPVTAVACSLVLLVKG
jgi:hypothetical protein